MKPRFRQSMNWLHTWSGFIFAWLLYFIFITGSAGYFENEIDRWMQPERVVVQKPMDDADILAMGTRQLSQSADDASQWYISFPSSRDPYIGISWLQPADASKGTVRQWLDRHLHPDSGDIITARQTSGGETLYRLHYTLYYMPLQLGYILTSAAAMLMLIALISGVIIHKKIFLEFFTFRTGKGLRSWLDMHNIFSVLPLPFHLMITYSGLMLLMTVTMAKVIDVTYGEGEQKHRQFYTAAQAEITTEQVISMSAAQLSPQAALTDAKNRYANLPVSYVGILARGTQQQQIEVWFASQRSIEFASMLSYREQDGQVVMSLSEGKAGAAARVYDVLEHLHEGLFADIYLRWLYFICGLLGAGMIATGAIMWLKKRLAKGPNSASCTLRRLASVNAGMILGIPVAIACYFASNRLLPFDMALRAQWELHCLFIGLLLSIGLAVCSATQSVWRNLCWLAAVMFGLLPLLNALTTKHNLLVSLIQADWLMLGFDLCMLVFSAAFVLLAIRLSKTTAATLSGDDVTRPL